MRYGDIQRIAFPWFLLMGPMIICAIVAEVVVGPSVRARTVIVLLFGLPALLGMIHAMGAYLFAAIRADLRRKRHAS